MKKIHEIEVGQYILDKEKNWVGQVIKLHKGVETGKGGTIKANINKKHEKVITIKWISPTRKATVQKKVSEKTSATDWQDAWICIKQETVVALCVQGYAIGCFDNVELRPKEGEEKEDLNELHKYDPTLKPFAHLFNNSSINSRNNRSGGTAGSESSSPASNHDDTDEKSDAGGATENGLNVSAAASSSTIGGQHSNKTKPTPVKVETWTCKGEGSMGCVLPQEKIESGEGHKKGCVNEKNRDSSKKEHYKPTENEARRRLASRRRLESRPIHRLLREINRAQGQA